MYIYSGLDLQNIPAGGRGAPKHQGSEPSGQGGGRPAWGGGYNGACICNVVLRDHSGSCPSSEHGIIMITVVRASLLGLVS